MTNQPILSMKERRRLYKEAREKQIKESIENKDRVLNKREEYKEEYDALFNLIRDAEKGSSWHIELLKIEGVLEKRTRIFIEKNFMVFWEERRRIFKSMEDKGAFGEKPEWEEESSGFKHYEKANR